MAQRIQDYLMVTLISVLIWLYAEGRNVQTYRPPDAVPLTVTLPNRDLLITRQEPSRVSMGVRGAVNELQEVRRQLPGGLHLELEITEPGEKTLVLGQELPRAQPLASRSVNVVDVDPPMLQIRVDRLVTVAASVSFRPSEVQLVGNAVVRPAQVNLILPQGRLEQMGAVENLTLELEPLTPIRALAAGVEHTVQARVRPPPALGAELTHVRIDPAIVQVTFTIDKKEDTHTLASVPVWFTSPPEDRNQYVIQPTEESRVLPDVRVTGPAELIQRIREGEVPVVANVRLSGDDLARGVGKENTASVRFDVPAGVSVESAITSVRYTIVRREQ